jgi:GNAT superfamily N-acetyltransferase
VSSAGPGEDDWDDEEDLPDAFDAGPGALPLAGDDPVPPEFAQDLGLDAAQANACIRCGNSCRSVYLWQGDLAEFKEQDTKKWVEAHELETFTAKRDGKEFWGVKLHQPCKHLIETEPGLFGCAIYERRPYICRIYKGVNPDGPQPGCGWFGHTRTFPERRYETREVAEHMLTRHDQDQLLPLLKECFPEHFHQRIWFKQLPRFRFLTYEGDRLVAQVGVEHRVIQLGNRDLRPIFGVIDLCVHPQHRNRGLADALLDRVETLAREQAIDFVVLFADDARLYRKRGYQHVDNDLRYMGISEGNTVGVLEGSFPDVMLVKQIGEAKWEPGRVDLLGYLF